ncbi:MAG: hypothetical protein ABIQ02_00005, partial [Saprospiraceae bacterium]
NTQECKEQEGFAIGVCDDNVNLKSVTGGGKTIYLIEKGSLMCGTKALSTNIDDGDDCSKK